MTELQTPIQAANSATIWHKISNLFISKFWFNSATDDIMKVNMQDYIIYLGTYIKNIALTFISSTLIFSAFFCYILAVNDAMKLTNPTDFLSIIISSWISVISIFWLICLMQSKSGIPINLPQAVGERIINIRLRFLQYATLGFAILSLLIVNKL